MPKSDDLPDIGSMSISGLKNELTLYCVEYSTFSEKQEFKSALQHARDTMPRPTTTFKEVEKPEEKKEKPRSSKKSSSTRSSSSRHQTSSSSSSRRSPAPSPPPQAAAPAPAPPQPNKQKDMKRALAARSPVTAVQVLREHPSEKILGERNNSFLPGSPFSFALKGSIRGDDAAIIRIPEGVCLCINTASVERKGMEKFMQQKGSIGMSLKISSEENPQLLPIWTFDKEKSKSYTVSDLGVRVSGPRSLQLLAFMEMGFRSGASVDLFVFGSVSLDTDKF